MTFHRGCPMLPCVVYRGAQELGGHTDRAMLAVNGEAGDPPNGGDVIKYPAEGTVAGNAGDVAPRHDSGPSRWDAVNVGHDTGRHRGRCDLVVERGAVIRRDNTDRLFEEPLAPAPAWIIATTSESDGNVVPTLGGRGRRPYRYH